MKNFCTLNNNTGSGHITTGPVLRLFSMFHFISFLLLQRVRSGNQGGPKCNTRYLSWQLFLHVFLQGASVAFSTWRLLNFAIPRKNLYLCLEFRRHRGGVRKDFIEKGVIEILIYIQYFNETLFTQFLEGTVPVPCSAPVPAHAGRKG